MKGLVVLVVDDDERYAAILTGLFETHGASVYRASTLATALRIMSQRQVSCVLVNLSLPDVSGSEAVQRVVQASHGAPVGVMTDSGEVRKEALQAGAAFYWNKGELQDNEVLVQAIRNAAHTHTQVSQQVAALHDSIHEAKDLSTKVQAAAEAERSKSP